MQPVKYPAKSVPDTQSKQQSQPASVQQVRQQSRQTRSSKPEVHYRLDDARKLTPSAPEPSLLTQLVGTVRSPPRRASTPEPKAVVGKQHPAKPASRPTSADSHTALTPNVSRSWLGSPIVISSPTVIIHPPLTPSPLSSRSSSVSTSQVVVSSPNVSTNLLSLSSSSSDSTLPVVMAEAVNVVPTPFKGTAAESPIDWLKGFKRFCTFKNLSNDRKRDLFALMLQGSSADWYEGLADGDRDSFDNLERAFKSRYDKPTTLRFREISQMFSRRQSSGESVDDFVVAIQKIGKDNGVDDAMILNAILNGLRPNISIWVNAQQPKSIADVLKFGRVAEASAPPSLNIDTSLVNQLAEVQEEVKQQSQAIRRLGDQVERVTIRPLQRSPTPTRRVTFNTTRNERARSPGAAGSNGNRSRYQHGQYTRGRQPDVTRGNNYRQQSQTSTDMCGYCGKFQRHVSSSQCPAYGKTCNTCRKLNHFSVVCRSRGRVQNHAPSTQQRRGFNPQAKPFYPQGNSAF